MSISTSTALLILVIFSFGANIPLGYLRQGTKKYSWRWFLYIHLSIPFIIALRLHFGISWRFIPLTLGCAIAGQMIGSRWRRRVL